MNAVLIADVLIVAGLLVTLGLIEVMLGDRDERAGQLFALATLAVAVAIIAAGRRFGGEAESDLIAWTLAATTLPRLWWPQRRAGGDDFATLSVCLAVTALATTLMWVSR
ncbi:MAG TPA: hypothetical protein VM165_08765 [Planctomycetaceae bacterium]|nr:hypothetical protein [Planctomycetaceae bacterium]